MLLLASSREISRKPVGRPNNGVEDMRPTGNDALLPGKLQDVLGTSIVFYAPNGCLRRESLIILQDLQT